MLVAYITVTDEQRHRDRGNKKKKLQAGERFLDYGDFVLGCFVWIRLGGACAPDRGWPCVIVLVAGDYVQVELRYLITECRDVDLVRSGGFDECTRYGVDLFEEKVTFGIGHIMQFS